MLCQLLAAATPPRASPAHIAPLVRAPLRKRRGRTPPPSAFTPCHSEAERGISPLTLREGGMSIFQRSADIRYFDFIAL